MLDNTIYTSAHTAHTQTRTHTHTHSHIYTKACTHGHTTAGTYGRTDAQMQARTRTRTNPKENHTISAPRKAPEYHNNTNIASCGIFVVLYNIVIYIFIYLSIVIIVTPK